MASKYSEHFSVCLSGYWTLILMCLYFGIRKILTLQKGFRNALFSPFFFLSLFVGNSLRRIVCGSLEVW